MNRIVQLDSLKLPALVLLNTRNELFVCFDGVYVIRWSLVDVVLLNLRVNRDG